MWSYWPLLPLISLNSHSYISLTRSLQSEWIFSQRVTPNCGHLFGALEEALTKKFILSLVGHECNKQERLLYSLPIGMRVWSKYQESNHNCRLCLFCLQVCCPTVSRLHQVTRFFQSCRSLCYCVQQSKQE